MKDEALHSRRIKGEAGRPDGEEGMKGATKEYKYQIDGGQIGNG